MANILTVEDSDFDFELIQAALGSTYKLVRSTNLKESIEIVSKQDFDLVILDMSLPDGDGIGLCSTLKENPKTANIPILFLSGKDDPNIKALGFQLGADDYITKPFHNIELKARIERRLSASQVASDSQKTRDLGPLFLDCERMSAKIGDDTALDLTPVEFKLLWTLSKRDGIIYSRPQLTEAVYGTNHSVSPRTIDSHIRSLRNKLGELSDSIRTVQGVGYKFAASAIKENP